jgi:protease-4
VLLLAVGLSGCSFSVVSKTKPLKQQLLQGERGPKVVVVDIEGLLVQQPEKDLLAERPSMVSRLREILDRAADDKQVAGLLLRIRSPGGTVSASEVMYHELASWKQRTGHPVVAYLEGVAASGGYFIAMTADSIVAHPTTVTGSIGVILWNLNLAGLMEKLGIADQTFTSGPYKDAGSPLRPMDEAERQVIQSVIDDFHARFKQVVAKGRPDLDAGELKALCDGRIFSAAQAVENGLVDEVGHFEQALEQLKRAIGSDELRVVTYRRPHEYRSNIYSAPPRPTVEVNLLTLGGRKLEPGFYYLWLPGGATGR